MKVGPSSSFLYLPNAPGFSINYSYRPRRWLALEAGLEQVPRPVGSSICCRYFTSANDELYLVPYGVRYVWEPERSRMRFSIGGGGAYLKHTAPQEEAWLVYPFSGWGAQFVVSGDYRLTRSGKFRVGVTGRYYYASPKISTGIYAPESSVSSPLHLVTIGPAFTFSFH